MKKMKGLVAVVVIVAIAVVAMGLLTSCGSSIGRTFSNIFSNSEIVYQATTRFLYSTDGGNSWSETVQEIPVNTTYYLAVEMQVTQSEETKDEKAVVSTITIPATNVLDCYLDDHPGVSITGKEDAETKSISYDFNVVAGTSPSKFRVVFECKPISAGRAEVQVVYDDNVSDSWDASGTIKYVETTNASNENATETSDEGAN